MNIKELTYLFYGHGCEYVLNPLYEEMKSQGYNCIEVDTLSSDIESLLPSLKEQKLVFLTSAHLLLDHENFTYFYKTDHKIYSPIELLSILKPTLSVFMPHDLSSPVSYDEYPYLSLFDLCLLPWEGLNALNNYVDCVEVGWPKTGIALQEESKHPPNNHLPINTSNSPLDPEGSPVYCVTSPVNSKPSYPAIWFLSNLINHLDQGFEHLLKWIEPLTSQNVAIKLPQWTDIKAIEDRLTKAGVTVIPSDTNIFEAMDLTDTVISNGTSSIVTESCLYGKQTINIRSNCEFADSKMLFSHLPEISFFDSPLEVLLTKPPSKNSECLLRPFSMEHFWAAIEKKMSEKKGI